MFKIRDRVSFIAPHDFEPYAKIEAGETGTVVGKPIEGHYEIRLDRLHPALRRWRNKVLELVRTCWQASRKDSVGYR